MVDKETFQEHFWWCLDRFREAASVDIGVPGYIRFMTLLGERWDYGSASSLYHKALSHACTPVVLDDTVYIGTGFPASSTGSLNILKYSGIVWICPPKINSWTY